MHISSSQAKYFLILVTRDGCGACYAFQTLYLEKLLNLVKPKKNKIRFLVLNVSQERKLPEAMSPYVTAFPSILLVTRKDFEKIFDGQGKVKVPHLPFQMNFSCKAFGMDNGIKTVEVMEVPNPVETIHSWIFFEISKS